MKLIDSTIAIRIEGIPSDVDYFASKGALFYHGQDPGLLASAYGPEPALIGVPPELDTSLDYQTGKAELSSSTFKISATESIAQRLMVNEGSAGEAPAELSQAISTDSESTVYVDSTETIQADDHLYIQDETLRVTSVVSVAGSTYELNVSRNYAWSDASTYDAGTPVYFKPPYMKYRQIELLSFDLDDTAPKVVWQGIVDDISTDDSQGVIKVSGAETMSVLWGVECGSAYTFSTYNLEWKSNDRLSGRIEYTGTPDWVNPNTDHVNVRVGDVAYKVRKEFGRLIANAEGSTFGTTPEVDQNDDYTIGREDVENEDVSVFLAWSRVGTDGNPQNDFDGVYGITGSEAHPAAVALAIMLSTGTNGNNLEYPVGSGTYRTFDRLGSKWGMGVPAKMVDSKSWNEVIDRVDATIDRIMLGWDGSFSAEEVVFDLLRSANLFTYITDEGRIGLRQIDNWSIDDITEVDSNNAYVHLNPKSAKLDRRLKEFSPTLKASIGGIGPDEEPDKVTLQQTQGFRRDSTLGQTPYSVNLPYADKLAYRLDRQRDADEATTDVGQFLERELQKRLDNPPILTGVAPLESAGGTEMLPPLGAWVAIKGGPEEGLIGPDGSFVTPENTEIIFIGVLVGRTHDLASDDVEIRVLLLNWWTKDRVSRLIAPAADILSYNPPTDEMEINSTLPDKRGQSGFLVGDDVKIVTESGRRWYADPGNLSITAVNDTGGTWTVTIPGISTAINTSDQLYLALDTVDNYSNSNWAGSGLYSSSDLQNRRYAYLADSNRKLGSSNQDGDIYS